MFEEAQSTDHADVVGRTLVRTVAGQERLDYLRFF